MADYIADVRKYDANADEEIVNKIVKNLGIALRNRESSLVSCTDPKELERVRTSWVGKKLGIDDQAAADAVITKVCEEMAADRAKNRVTFYYLTAKHLGKLASL